MRAAVFQSLFFLLVFSSLHAQEVTHECGIALLRLFKPLGYYQEKYHDRAWGAHKTCLLLEKQRNRGQDSVGFAVMQFDMPSGYPFMKRCRSCKKNALESLLAHVNTKLEAADLISATATDDEVKKEARMLGEIYLGHLRYATHGGNKLKHSQPYRYDSSIPAKCLLLAGNFNMTNNSEIMKRIARYGVNPIDSGDTHLLVNQLSYAIDRAYEAAFSYRKMAGDMPIEQASQEASEAMDILQAIRYATTDWDGGYVLAGIIGNGDSFIMRDPAGIRPGYFCYNDEYFAAASERSALMNAFNIAPEKIEEVPPGTIIIIKKSGNFTIHRFKDRLPLARCTFERIYFSRACDPDIYKERKLLGVELAKRLYHQLDNLNDTVFCYIPNTSEIAFHGLVQEIDKLCFIKSCHQLRHESPTELSNDKIEEIFNQRCRVEKILFKDQAIRTFIANDAVRADLISKVYDVTRGIIEESDTLIVIDDSIVRGATLRQSIIKRLITLNPKKIVILSAAPLVLYPDCYGIDMSQIANLIGFQAAIALTRERGNNQLIDALYNECLQLKDQMPKRSYNPIKKLYDQFSQKELEDKIAQMVYPIDSPWSGQLQVIYQSVEGLRRAMPDYTGDWYFTGNYPTPGGFNVVINSYINWYQNNSQRAY